MRRDIETQTGRPVVSAENYLGLSAPLVVPSLEQGAAGEPENEEEREDEEGNGVRRLPGQISLFDKDTDF